MTRVLLIQSGSTPWDTEDRLVGDHSLPLTIEAEDAIGTVVNGLDTPVTAVYYPAANEGCKMTAKIVALRFGLRPRHHAGLDEVSLGLWQGLTRAEVRFRFPSVYQQWEEQPLSVIPPEGEALAAAIQRLATAIRKIVGRNAEASPAFCLRPMALQIAKGVLEGEKPEAIAAHLHEAASLVNINLA